MPAKHLILLLTIVMACAGLTILLAQTMFDAGGAWQPYGIVAFLIAAALAQLWARRQ